MAVLKVKAGKAQLTAAGIAVSVVLLILKLWAGSVSKSIAVISDALNSFLDLFSYTVILLSVRYQSKEADRSHPFGHQRAEPLAGFVVALMAVILGINVIKDAAISLAEGTVPRQSGLPLIVLFVSIAVKIVMSILYAAVGKETNSLALNAASIDSRNDVLASTTALVGFFLKGYWDGIAGIAIGIWILYSGVRMGLSNSAYLLGNAPERNFIAGVKQAALEVDGVLALNDIRAHFVGSTVDVEIHIEVKPHLTISDAHDIGVAVQERIERMTDIGNVFVHIDVLGDPERLSIAP